MINLRDLGAAQWEKWNRPKRTAFSLLAIVLVGILPILNISLLNTPSTSYADILVYPVGMFVLMSLGLNIVVGKSGMLDLGYVAFSLSAHTQWGI